MENNEVKNEILYIKQMIEDSKRKMFDNGMHYIVWGILVAIACTGTFFLIETQNYSYINRLWAVIYITGGIVSFVLGARQGKKIPLTFLGKVIIALWLSSLIVISFMIFATLYSPHISDEITVLFPALILSIAHYVSGHICENNILKISGICWFASSFVFLFWVSSYNLLLFAILIIVLQVIPGITLYRKYSHAEL